MNICGVEFIEYQRSGNKIVIGSGCGISMAMMDEIVDAVAFVDVDCYRFKEIDWQMVGALLDKIGYGSIILVGWFTIDRAKCFDDIQSQIQKTPVFRYEGGGDLSYADFLKVISMQAIN